MSKISQKQFQEHN